MNAVVEMKQPSLVADAGRMSVAEIMQHAITVQEVMRAIMKPDIHYGKIPGTDKPTLLKPGAEVLCMTFRVADEYQVEDLSDAQCIRYRVVCRGVHQSTGVVLGSGMGEASTSEEKYRWRKAVCREEYDATPANMRRVKFGKKSGGFYTTEQVRTEDADLANTALKMACKRAKIAMVLNVTAASDMFSQDLEDLDDVLREHLTHGEKPDLTPMRDKWLSAAADATSKDELTAVWQAGLAEIRPTKDMTLYEAFKDAVGKRGQEIQSLAAKAAEKPAAEQPAAPAADPAPKTETEGEQK